MSQTSRVTTAAYTVPTEAPESDGTLDWDSTTIVVVGLGYSYADAAAAVTDRRSSKVWRR
jgi:hypothetical protein